MAINHQSNSKGFIFIVVVWLQVLLLDTRTFGSNNGALKHCSIFFLFIEIGVFDFLIER